jgi:ATP phosphoribosyltransferase regulatory subunit
MQSLCPGGTFGNSRLISPAPARYVSRMPSFPISHIPPGSQDLLAGDVRRRRKVQAEWFALAEERGYDEVIPPTFEYEEVFTRGAGADLAARLVRFVDQDGRLVALRADFTSSIARVAASRLASAPLPQRLSYAGKVYRQEPEGGGRRRELFQLGSELIGAAGPEADVEVLRLVIDLLHRLDIRDFQINLGEVGFVRPLLAGLPAEASEGLRGAIDRKDRAELSAAARRWGPREEIGRALEALPELIGRGEMLTRATGLAAGEEAEEAIARLRTIDALLTPGEREHVVYDLGEIRGLGYYTGIQFEMFVAGVGRAVGFGGRYDGLLALYGVDRPAVGFALETDALAELVAEDRR